MLLRSFSQSVSSFAFFERSDEEMLYALYALSVLNAFFHTALTRLRLVDLSDHRINSYILIDLRISRITRAVRYI